MKTKAPLRPPTRGQSRWNWHYRTLVAARKRLLRESAEREREAADCGDRGADATHRSTEQLNLDTSLALLASETRMLGEIESALLRIKRGVYGYCVASGKRISPARLRAVPWCRYTRAVEQAKEAQSAVKAP